MELPAVSPYAVLTAWFLNLNAVPVRIPFCFSVEKERSEAVERHRLPGNENYRL